MFQPLLYLLVPLFSKPDIPFARLQADRGELISQDEARQRMAKWLQ